MLSQVSRRPTTAEETEQEHSGKFSTETVPPPEDSTSSPPPRFSRSSDLSVVSARLCCLGVHGSSPEVQQHGVASARLFSASTAAPPPGWAPPSFHLSQLGCLSLGVPSGSSPTPRFRKCCLSSVVLSQVSRRPTAAPPPPEVQQRCLSSVVSGAGGALPPNRETEVGIPTSLVFTRNGAARPSRPW